MSDASVFGFSHFFAQLDAVGVSVLALLLAMSVLSWYLIVVKSIRMMQMQRASHRFAMLRGEGGEAAVPKAGAGDADSAMARLTTAADDAARGWREASTTGTLNSDRQEDFLGRCLRSALAREAVAMEAGLAPLASVASAAPFVGLFGTVWAIYHALVGIGFSGKAGLDAVAGPVGEALIMTALGLAVAIPALLAYNAFTRVNRVTLAELDGFAHTLHADLLIGHRPARYSGSGRAPVRVVPGAA